MTIGTFARTRSFVALVLLASCSDNGGPSVPGRRLLFVSSQGRYEDIYVIRPPATAAQNLTNTIGDDDQPAWAPDRSRIAFISYRTGHAEIWMMDSLGGNQTQLTHDSGAAGRPTWSLDGSMLMYASNGALRTIPADGSDTSVMLALGGADPAWNPHGNRIALGGGTLILVIDPDGGNESAADLHQGLAAGQPSWSPNGRQLVFSRVNQDAYHSLVVSDTDRVFEHDLDSALVANHVVGAADPSWSADGIIAFTCNVSSDPFNGQYDLCLIHSDGTHFQHLATGSSVERWPAWAP